MVMGLFPIDACTDLGLILPVDGRQIGMNGRDDIVALIGGESPHPADARSTGQSTVKVSIGDFPISDMNRVYLHDTFLLSEP
jgi:hypothetical protein